jgi:hypothetical protein
MSPRTLHVFMIALSIACSAVCLEVSSASGADAARIAEELETSWPDWLADLDKCPADVMSAHDAVVNFSIERCSAEMEQCLDRCRNGDANDCYATANALQKIRDGRLSDALFLRACALGIVSGCTNRAARMDFGKGGSCALRTYQLGCDRKDPWACTMIGFHLIRGIGTDKDFDRARRALAQSCRLGDDDPACITGKTLLKEIDH